MYMKGCHSRVFVKGLAHLPFIVMDYNGYIVPTNDTSLAVNASARQEMKHRSF
jgi:hypothetical protein